MAEFWARRIGYNLARIGEVPALWREQVRAIIEQTEPSAAEALGIILGEDGGND